MENYLQTIVLIWTDSEVYFWKLQLQLIKIAQLFCLSVAFPFGTRAVNISICNM